MTDAPINPYQELPFTKTKRIKLNVHSPFTPTFLASSLSQASDPAAIYANRVQGRQLLLENPVKESGIKKKIQERRLKRRVLLERRQIGKNEAREKGFWRFDQAQVKFCSILPLHRLWMDYMSELLGLPQPGPTHLGVDASHYIANVSGMQAKLVKADLHGSIITVHQSKNTSTLGLSGIVMLDTENTFTVITRQDKVKVIPKQNTIFVISVPLYQTTSLLWQSTGNLPPLPPQEPTPADDALGRGILTALEMPHIEFKLYGNQFRFHSADRASRKFKHKETIELS